MENDRFPAVAVASVDLGPERNREVRQWAEDLARTHTPVCDTAGNLLPTPSEFFGAQPNDRLAAQRAWNTVLLAIERGHISAEQVAGELAAAMSPSGGADDPPPPSREGEA
jgi:hypothetical protein